MNIDLRVRYPPVLPAAPTLLTPTICQKGVIISPDWDAASEGGQPNIFEECPRTVEGRAEDPTQYPQWQYFI